MTLRPNDYDKNGDIIPDSVREDKEVRLIDANALKVEHIYALVNDKSIEKGISFAPITCVLKEEIDNAPTVDTTCPHCDSGYAQGFSDGYLRAKEDVIHSIAKQYSEHNELVPIWLSIGDMKGGEDIEEV